MCNQQLEDEMHNLIIRNLKYVSDTLLLKKI